MVCRSRIPFVEAALAGALTLVLLTAACAASNTIELSQADSGTKVMVAPGAEIQVVLDSNATTGFSWTVVDAGPTRQVGGPKYDAPETGAVGAGGTETFTFTAADSGSGQMRLEYRRPWEEGSPAEKTWTADIEIQ